MGGGGTCTGKYITVDAQGFVAFSIAAYSAGTIHVDARMGSALAGGTVVTVNFNEAADTNLGQNIYVIGNVSALGGWAGGSAKPLTGVSGAGTRGNWSGTVALPPSTSVEYKYIKKDGSGNVVWESGANHVLNSGAGGTSQSTSDVWK